MAFLCCEGILFFVRRGQRKVRVPYTRGVLTDITDVETDDRAIQHISGNLKDVDSDRMDVSQDSLSDMHDGKYQQEQITLTDDDSMVLSEDKENVLPMGPGGDNMEDSQEFLEEDFGEGHLEHPVEKKLRTEGRPSDAMSTGSQDSGKGGKTGSDCPSNTSSKPNSSEGTSKSPTHKLDSKEKTEKDALRKERDREREERIKQQREKLAHERQQKIDEMREQQKAAQEKREKQLEARRMKIDELRRREEERRKEVEERRKKQDEEDRARKEAIIMKSRERITRYEQWKAHTNTRKGGISYVIGFGSRAPREVCQPLERRRSSSHSTLFRRSPHGSDSDSYRPHRRAFSACSVRRHCCIDINKLTGQGLYFGTSPPSKHLSQSTSVLYHKRNQDFTSAGNLTARDRPESLLALNTIPESSQSFLVQSKPPSRPKSTVNLSHRENVKLRERTTPRKPRPSSVAGSTPSVMTPSPNAAQLRSKSTDRLSRPRDRSRPGQRTTPKREKDEHNKQEKALDSKDDSKKTDTKKPFRSSTLERKRKEAKKEESKDDKDATPSKSDKATPKINMKTLERLSTPKNRPKTPPKVEVKETQPVKAKSSPKHVEIKETTKDSKKKSTSPVPPTIKVDDTPAALDKAVEKAEESRDDVAVSVQKELEEKGAVELQSPEEKEVTVTEEGIDLPQEQVSQQVPHETEDSEGDIPRTVTPEQDTIDRAISPPAKPERTPTPTRLESKSSPAKQRAAPATGSATSTPNKSQKEQELEEYKAKLAEKRRQAREKAEREAELERQRQEELRLQEEERIRKEEEEQRKAEEEAQRLAALAKEAEEERLRKAIEAEEERRKQEAEKAEQEKKMKEEAERKAKEEAERAEKERIEKAKRDEEERQERKKRLESIMKRVKSDSPMTASASTDSLKNDTMSSSMTGSLSKIYSSSENLLEEKKDKENGVTFNLEDSDAEKDKLQTPTTGASKFKSPLLQKLVENKPSQNGGSETPKFKSPLLQSLLGKKSRRGLDKTDGDKSDSEGLSDSEKVDDVHSDSKLESATEQKQESSTKVEITPDPSSIESEDSSAGTDSRTDLCDDDTVITKGDKSVQNGCVHNGETSHHELVDSSISMRTIDSSITTDDSVSGSLIDSQSQAESGLSARQQEPFEEYIDLSVSNKGVDVHSSSYGNSDDLLNFNTRHSLDNRDAGEEIIPKPIIAFEDNATRRQEVSVLRRLVTTGDSINTSHSNSHDILTLDNASQGQGRMEKMWQQLEEAMFRSQDHVEELLKDHGIGEGCEDSESEEGQIWGMVQGDSPYTIEFV
ncbi:hypothetical protein FSP39_017473 [Pinctada imbricata]|uniref:Ensconsin-like n=1 Tax=Pinctada imbricata TaxID=66713 RepID=A0AA89C3W3_PINIB|nr:hypothetical protein FSP39_017473 [Pinctada imbricata]